MRKVDLRKKKTGFEPERRLQKVLEICELEPALRKNGPRTMPWEVGFRKVGSREMATLNLKYRGKKYATDVLSFPVGSPFWDQGMLGDLVVCLPTLKAQAKQMKHSVAIEWDVLLVHGVLHLLSFDHEKSPGEARKMARWEMHILEKLGRKKEVAGLIERVSK